MKDFSATLWNFQTCSKGGHRLLEGARRVLQDSIRLKNAVGHRQPNGFVVVTPEPSSVGRAAVRIHVWPAEGRIYQEPRWPIHNHRWPFKSLVLCGHLMQDLYAVNDGTGYQLYEVSYQDNFSTLIRHSRQIDTVRVDSTALRPGTVYGMESNKYHSVDVEEGVLAASIFVTGTPLDRNPTVVGQRGGKPEYRFEREQLSWQCLERLLRSVVSDA